MLHYFLEVREYIDEDYKEVTLKIFDNLSEAKSSGNELASLLDMDNINEQLWEKTCPISERKIQLLIEPVRITRYTEYW